MLQYAFYSVISPEGCAAILFKTGAQASRAAESLRLTARDLKKLELIDDIIPEPIGGAHRHKDTVIQSVEDYIGTTLRGLKRLRTDTLLKRRYDRLRNWGSFFESEAEAKRARAASQRKSKAPGTGRTIGQRPGATRKPKAAASA